MMDADVRKFRKYLSGLEKKDQNIIDLSIPGYILYADYAGPIKNKCKHWVYKVSKDDLDIYTSNGSPSRAYRWGTFSLSPQVCLINGELIPFEVRFYVSRCVGGRTCVDLINSNFKLIRNLTDLGLKTDYNLLDQIQIPGESNPKKAFGMDPRIFKNCWSDSDYYLARTVHNKLRESYKFYENIRWNRLTWNLETLEIPERTSKNIRYLSGLSSEDQNYYSDYRRLRTFLSPLPKEFGLYPTRVKELHDKLLLRFREIQAQQLEEEKTKLQTTYIENYYEKAKKYEYEFEKYRIIACKDLAELTQEGNVLHHCVGSYKHSVGNGKEYILFLRNKSDLDKPLYTIDISSDNELRQIHGMCNKNLPESLIKMLTPWAKKFNLNLSQASGICCHL